MMANIWWSLPLTLIVFFAARKLAARYKFPLLNPLLVAMVVIIPFLMLTGISYDSYFKGSEVLNDLLQPAVVALAYPLYEQLHQIRARWKSIITICFIGSVVLAEKADAPLIQWDATSATLKALGCHSIDRVLLA